MAHFTATDLRRLRDHIRAAARDVLDPKSCLVIERRLKHSDDSNAYGDIALDLGVTRERIRQIHARAFNDLYRTQASSAKCQRLAKTIHDLVRPGVRGYQKRLIELSAAILPHSRPSSSVWILGRLAGIDNPHTICPNPYVKARARRQLTRPRA